MIIKDFMFQVPASVQAGSTITIKNEDSTPHTFADADNNTFDVVVKDGTSETLTAPKAGTYQIKCDYHPTMHGTLVVK